MDHKLSGTILAILYSLIFIIIGQYWFKSSVMQSLLYGWLAFAIVGFLIFAIGMTITDTPGIGFNYPLQTCWYSYK